MDPPPEIGVTTTACSTGFLRKGERQAADLPLASACDKQALFQIANSPVCPSRHARTNHRHPALDSPIGDGQRRPCGLSPGQPQWRCNEVRSNSL